jgi:hypothetical protein
MPELSLNKTTAAFLSIRLVAEFFETNFGAIRIAGA